MMSARTRALGLAATVALTAVPIVSQAPAAHAVTDGGCTYRVWRTYPSKYLDGWMVRTSGKVTNSSRATISPSVSSTVTGSLTASLSNTLTVKVSGAVVEASNALDLGLSVTASISLSHSFVVTVPPGQTVHYETGIRHWTIAVQEHTRYSNCNVTTKSSALNVGELYDHAW